MEIKRISDNVWEVPKHGKMNVPLLIYASEKLMRKMEEDGAIQQGINVASLPGIQKQSIMLADAHYGYGFSIGGVAAIDAETGCITPGGVGFDINCLPKDTKIMTEHGYFKPIQTFEENFSEIEITNSEYSLKAMKNTQSLVSFNVGQKSFSSKEPAFFMKKKHSSPIFEIKTRLGYSIQTTGDHPILTMNGMIKSKNLVKRQEIAMFPFKGVPYEKISEDKVLVEEELFTKPQQNELKKRNLLPFTLKNEYLPIITKLFGYLLGDGTIYLSGNKGYVCAYGPEEDLKDIQKDFNTLGFKARIYSRERDHSIPTRYGKVEFTSNNYELHVSSKSLAKLFFELGYPFGNKTSTRFLVPPWIMESPLWIKRLFLSGFFGAEMSSPSTSSKTCFYCPTVSINKNSVQLDNAREYAIQIMTLLEEFDVKTHKLQVKKDYVNKQGPTHRLKIMISSEEKSLINLYEKISYSYNKKREKLSHLAILYTKEKMLLKKKRKEISKKVKEYKNIGLKLEEVQKLLACGIANNRFVERHYYEKAGQRITLTFPSFNEYLEKKSKELEEYGCLFDKIESITKKDYDDFVYDFNIPQTHNFIANNIIVSNCGVRLLTTNLTKEDVEPKIRDVLISLFKNVPSGVGSESKLRLTDEELDAVLKDGAKWAVEHKYGIQEDLDHCEEQGTMPGADPKKVSPRAKARGRKQLGTLGAGNHFLEVQVVDEIYDKDIAKKFGITKKGQITIMIHCGSRGLGHQVCSDYLRKLEDAYPDIMEKLPEKDLIYAPAGSPLAGDYFGAMCAAANYAWANRHIIAHNVRKSFKELFPKSELKTVYDVAHNIAKLEEHEIDGKKKKVYVHRKGATRAFAPGREEVPKDYRDVGQPILIPGSMGTASYILAGTETAMKETFGSTAHGAGRMMSRHAAINTFRAETVKDDLEKQNIYIKSASWKGICEEAPGAYKDVDEVVKSSHEAGIGKLIARVRPFGVIKG